MPADSELAVESSRYMPKVPVSVPLIGAMNVKPSPVLSISIVGSVSAVVILLPISCFQMYLIGAINALITSRCIQSSGVRRCRLDGGRDSLPTSAGGTSVSVNYRTGSEPGANRGFSQSVECGPTYLEYWVTRIRAAVWEGDRDNGTPRPETHLYKRQPTIDKQGAGLNIYLLVAAAVTFVVAAAACGGGGDSESVASPVPGSTATPVPEPTATATPDSPASSCV